MAEVVATCKGGLHHAAYAISRRCGQAQAGGGHGISRGFKSYGWQTVGEAEKRADGPSKRVSGEPDVRVGIESGDIMVQLLRGAVIMILLLQVLDETCRIARECRRLTVADLVPEEGASLGTTAREEQIVVDLVVRRRICAVKHGR